MWKVNFNADLIVSMLIGLLSFIVCYFTVYRKRKQKNSQYFALCLLHIYIFSVLSLTVFCFISLIPNMGTPNFAAAYKAISWSPFDEALTLYKNCRYSGSMAEFIRLIGGNFIMLMPLGILVPVINKKVTFSDILLMSICVPLVVEGIQFIGNSLLYTYLSAYGSEMVRDVSVSDFLLNALGCVSGYGIYSLFAFMHRKGKKTTKNKNKKH